MMHGGRWLAVALLLGTMPALAGQRYDVRTLYVGTAPEKPIAVPEWDMVLVPIGQEPRIAVLDASADARLDDIDTLHQVDRLAFDAERNRLLAVIGGTVDRAGSIEVFEPRAIGFERIAVIPTNLRSAAFGAELNRVKGELVITDRHLAGTLDLASLAYIEAPDALRGVNHMVIPDSGERVLVVEQETSDMLALSSDLARRELQVRNWTPAAVAYSALRDRILVVSPKLRILQIIDPDTGLDAHSVVDAGAVAVLADDAAGKIWVGHNATPTVRRIDSGSLASQAIPIGGHSFPIVLDDAVGRLYALDPDASLVSVVDTTREVCEASWPVGARPRYAVVEPRTHKIYTSNVGDGTVSILRPLPDPAQSEFSVSRDYIDADGISTSRATVLPRGSDGLPLGSGHNVVIQSTAGTLVGTVVDNLDGTYHQDLQASTTVETGILTAMVDEVGLERRPRVSFARSGWPNARVPDPAWDLTSGDRRVVISGDGFATELRLQPGRGQDAAQIDIEVRFDGVAARVESFTDTEIVCWTPPHAAGVVDISVVKLVADERRECFLRQGFTYVEEESLLSLVATRGPQPGTVSLVWARGPSGPVTLERSSRKDFSADLTAVSGLTGPGVSELAPSWPRIQYYRIGR